MGETKELDIEAEIIGMANDGWTLIISKDARYGNVWHLQAKKFMHEAYAMDHNLNDAFGILLSRLPAKG